jgi:hypothetical protein
MPTYATVTSLITHMVGASFTTTSTLASDCIERAEATIDSYLARRYDLTESYFQTTTATPPLVNQWAIELGAGYLWGELARGGSGKESTKRSETLIERVTKELEKLRNKQLELVAQDGSLISDKSTGVGSIRCNTTDYPNTFNEGRETRWKVSTEKRRAISEEQD